MWSPGGSQAFDWVAQVIHGFEPGVCERSVALGLCMGQPATDPGAHPLEVSGVGVQATYEVVRPPGVSGVGPRSLIGFCAQANGLLIRGSTHPEF